MPCFSRSTREVLIVSFKRFKFTSFQKGACIACLVRLCNAEQLVPLRLTSGYEQLYKLCPSRLCLQVTSLAETNSQLGHRGRVALDSKKRPPVALIESRKTIGPQRRLSSSGERYVFIKNFLIINMATLSSFGCS